MSFAVMTKAAPTKRKFFSQETNDKKELKSMHNRVARYFKRVQSVELENKIFETQLSKLNCRRGLNSSQKNEDKLRRLSQVVDKLTRERTKAEMERDKFARKAKHYHKKYEKEHAARKELEIDLARMRMDCDDACLVLERKIESMVEEMDVTKKIHADDEKPIPLAVKVVDYVPGSKNENARIVYVKLGKNEQFEWDKPLMDTKKEFKEKYKHADIAIALFEKNRVAQVNKTGPIKKERKEDWYPGHRCQNHSSRFNVLLNACDRNVCSEANGVKPRKKPSERKRSGPKKKRRRWDQSEDANLIAGVNLYGTSWITIKKKLFSSSRRTNVNLKDRHRQLLKEKGPRVKKNYD